MLARFSIVEHNIRHSRAYLARRFSHTKTVLSKEVKSAAETNTKTRENTSKVGTNTKIQENASKVSLYTKFIKFTKEYGAIGLGTYMSISTSSLTLIYLAISSGVDIPFYVGKFGLSISPQMIQKSGTFIAALLVNKLLFPLRATATFFLTPRIAKGFSTLR